MIKNFLLFINAIIGGIYLIAGFIRITGFGAMTDARDPAPWSMYLWFGAGIASVIFYVYNSSKRPILILIPIFVLISPLLLAQTKSLRADLIYKYGNADKTCENLVVKYNCYAKFGIAQEDYLLCDKAERLISYCYYHIAINRKEIGLCENVPNESEKKQCYTKLQGQ